MDLSTFIEDPNRHQRLADRIGTSKGWLWQIATGWRGKRASVEMAMKIERESEAIGPEAVSRSVLRPDIWPLANLPEAANDDTGPAPDCAEEG